MSIKTRLLIVALQDPWEVSNVVHRYVSALVVGNGIRQFSLADIKWKSYLICKCIFQLLGTSLRAHCSFSDNRSPLTAGLARSVNTALQQSTANGVSKRTLSCQTVLSFPLSLDLEKLLGKGY